jgi:hypothetical protein
MKLNLACAQCLVKQEIVCDIKPVNNSHLYDISCAKGHESLYIIQNPSFDMLFQSGLELLRTGYYREAVSSFAVSLERFYEYCVLLLSLDRFPDTGGKFVTFHLEDPLYMKAIRDYEKLWKTPLKYSERQIGAFYALYFNKHGEIPLLFDQTLAKNLGHKLVKDPINFRNRVIHEGFIPRYEEAVQYGETVYHYIKVLFKILSSKEIGKDYVASDQAWMIEVNIDLMRRGIVRGFDTANSINAIYLKNFLFINVMSRAISKGIEGREPQLLKEYIDNNYSCQ